jgi:hypothetical protein
VPRISGKPSASREASDIEIIGSIFRSSAGASWRALCPFIAKTPSFHVIRSAKLITVSARRGSFFAS